MLPAAVEATNGPGLTNDPTRVDAPTLKFAPDMGNTSSRRIARDPLSSRDL